MAKFTNNQFADNSVDSRVVKDKSILSSKLEDNITIRGNALINGNLKVLGDVVNEDVQVDTLHVQNSEIVLNSGLTINDKPNKNGANIRVNRGNKNRDVNVRWREDRELWQWDQDIEMVATDKDINGKYIRFSRYGLNESELANQNDYGGILWDETYPDGKITNNYKIIYNGLSDQLEFYSSDENGNNSAIDIIFKKQSNAVFNKGIDASYLTIDGKHKIGNTISDVQYNETEIMKFLSKSDYEFRASSSTISPKIKLNSEGNINNVCIYNEAGCTKIVNSSNNGGFRLYNNETELISIGNDMILKMYSGFIVNSNTISKIGGPLIVGSTGSISSGHKMEVAGAIKSSSITLTAQENNIPINISNKILIPNLNADFLDGYHASSFSLNTHTHDFINIKNTRSENPLPKDIPCQASFDLKYNTTNELVDGGIYNGVMTFRKWGTGEDFTAGQGSVNQLSFTENGNIFIRRSSGANAWTQWTKILSENHYGHGNNIDADKLDGKHADEFLSKTGGTMTGNILFSNSLDGIVWNMNSDGAWIKFKNDGDSDTDSYLNFHTQDNGNEYFKFTSNVAGTVSEWMSIKGDGVRVKGNLVYHTGNKPTPQDINASPSNHDHRGVYEPLIDRNTAFNKNFGITQGTVSEGNHNHDSVYLKLAGGNVTGETRFSLPTRMSMIKFTNGNSEVDRVSLDYNNETGRLDIKTLDDSGVWTTRISTQDRRTKDSVDVLVNGKYKIYHEGNKPTVNDMNAISVTGGDMTGALKFTGSNGIIMKQGNTEAKVLWSHNNGNITFGAVNGDLLLGYNEVDYGTTNKIMLRSNLYNNLGTLTIVDVNGKLYYQGNDIDNRYLKLTGGTVSGALTVSNKLSVGGRIEDSRITTGNLQLINSAGDKIYVGNPNTNLILESSSNPILNRGGSSFYLYHTGNKPTASDVGAITEVYADGKYSYRTLRRDNYLRITIGGDADTYYPVLINMGRNGYGYARLDINRGYSWDAPDTWNTTTHKGGLTFSLRWTGDTSWGGNSRSISVLEFNETYSTMVGGMKLSTNGLIVWLRGGGALYQIENDYGTAVTAQIFLEGYTDGGKNEYVPRTQRDVSLISDEIKKRWTVREGMLYDTDSRVYSPVNKPSASDLGVLPSSGGTISGDLRIEKNSSPSLYMRNTDDVQGNEPRIVFENRNKEQDVSIRYNAHDSERSPFGIHIERGPSNTSQLKTYLEVEGEIYADSDKIVYHSGNLKRYKEKYIPSTNLEANQEIIIPNSRTFNSTDDLDVYIDGRYANTDDDYTVSGNNKIILRYPIPSETRIDFVIISL